MLKNNFKKPESIPGNKNTGQKISTINQGSDKKAKNITALPDQQTEKTAESNDLKEILMSKGSELRFTIKMSRE